jgi:hypothetical protein
MRLIDFAFIISLTFAAVIAAGCDNRNSGSGANPPPAGPPAPAATPAKAASITAVPNPVPAGDGFGTTRIAWESGRDWGQVFISENGAADTKMFAEGARGAGDAAWIKSGHTYEFRLYAGKDHSQLLDKVLVTRATK